MKAGYEKQFHITWLAMAPLNDTYGICSTQARAGQLHATKVSDLASAASTLTVATPPDGQTDPNVLPGHEGALRVHVRQADRPAGPLTFAAVEQGKADVNVCYTTSALIAKNHFVLLNDDKHLFPIYHPPRSCATTRSGVRPASPSALNPLAPKLTSEVSQRLQLEVVNGTSVSQAAGDWLKSVGLL